MKILVLQESDWIERGPHQSHHLFERLSRRGHEVRVVDFEIGQRTQSSKWAVTPRTQLVASSKVVAGSQIQVIRPTAVHLPILDYASILVMHGLEVRKQLSVFRPDVVVGLGLLNAFVGIRAAKRREIPFVYYLIDELHQLVREPALRSLARLIEGANIRRAPLVLAINRSLRQYTIEMGAEPDRTRVLPAGVELDRFVHAEDGTTVRKQLGFGERDLVLFFMGWVYPFSGLLEIAQGLAGGEGREDHVKLLVVGKGDSWSELVQLSKAPRAENRIKLVDFKPYSEMPSYLAAADICLLPAQDVPTMRNIVPIKMYEYLAAGKPVIATRLPGLVEEFGEGNGIVYVKGPVEVLSKASELARQGELRKLGRSGRDLVSQNDWAKVTDTFESYLKAIVGRKGSRDEKR